MTGILNLTVEPNRLLTIRLGVIDDIGAMGRRSFSATGGVASAYRMAVYVPTASDDADVPQWCCSQAGASWASGSYLASRPNQILRTGNGSYAELKGLDVDWGRLLATDAGVAIRNSRNAACNDVVIDALRLEDILAQANVELYDMTGRLVFSNRDIGDGYDLDIPDGMYVERVYDNFNQVARARQIVIMNGRGLNTRR